MVGFKGKPIRNDSFQPDSRLVYNPPCLKLAAQAQDFFLTHRKAQMKMRWVPCRVRIRHEAFDQGSDSSLLS